ncbi:MAG TPA: threonine synthase [Bacillota bacterium]|nr:threonine synthase [Bacillota bacterium]
MRYLSTRSKNYTATASEAILSGIAPDGGLYVPESFPQINFGAWNQYSYREIAEKIFSLFLTDYSPAAIRRIVKESYADNFDCPEITPLHWLDEDTAVLELWHGPTLAFKDLALQCLPNLFEEAKRILQIEERFLILTATSGDTGKAAMSGFSGKDGTLVAVFYPNNGVSTFQERQMLTTTSPNVRAFAMEGNFDDCQRSVKALMRDESFLAKLKKQSIRLTSANSINIGRLIPQMVYYIYAYLQSVGEYGEPLSVVVPSGNVGNILAARYCKEMGLPLDRIHLAANSNKVLHDFLSTGIYDANRELLKTTSPSMDILVASNMERYLHLLTDDCAYIDNLMKALKTEGRFYFDSSLLDLDSSWADESQVFSAIRRVYVEYGYLLDPHSAVAAFAILNNDVPARRLIVSTASPYKFADTVLSALRQDFPPDDKGQILQLQMLLGTPLPPTIEELWSLEPQDKYSLLPEKIESAIGELIGANYE